MAAGDALYSKFQLEAVCRFLDGELLAVGPLSVALDPDLYEIRIMECQLSLELFAGLQHYFPVLEGRVCLDNFMDAVDWLVVTDVLSASLLLLGVVVVDGDENWVARDRRTQ